MEIHVVKIYTDVDSEGFGNPRDVVLFTNKTEAEKFRDDIKDDDGLAGINDVTIDTQETDEKGVGQWWEKVNKEGGLDDLEDAWPTENGRNVGL